MKKREYYLLNDVGQIYVRNKKIDTYIAQLRDEMNVNSNDEQFISLLGKYNALVDVREKKHKQILDTLLSTKQQAEELATYEKKLSDVMAKLEKYNEEKYQFLHSNERSKAIRTRLNTFRKVIQEKQSIDEFDRAMFESIVDKVIVGGYDDEGNPDPHMLTFIYKTGFTNSVDSDKHKPERKNGRAKEFMNLPSFADKTREKLAEILPSFQSSDTRRDVRPFVQTKIK